MVRDVDFPNIKMDSFAYGNCEVMIPCYLKIKK